MDVYTTTLSAGISRTKEFERKKLAAYAVNIGTKCGHGCEYCSTGALLRMHPSFSAAGRSPFEQGYAIVDPNTPERVARDARRIRRPGLVQLCTTVDAWSPEAQQHELGRRCLEAILNEPGWTVRILTKNAAVVRDYDLIHRHRDRVLVGLSITATHERASVVAAIEPHASSIPERISALRQAHASGLRTYAMFCPLVPGVADGSNHINELVRLAVEAGAEEVFAEPVNARGPGLRHAEEALERNGFHSEAAAVAKTRRRTEWSRYALDLVRNMQRSMRAMHDIDKLRILLYPSRLTPEDAERIRGDDAGVIWLGKGS